MNTEYNIYEEIDLYLKGKLKEEQLTSFEKRLAEDPEFAHQVKLQQAANQVIMVKQLSLLQEKIKNDLQNQTNGKNSFRNLFMAVAIVLTGSALTYFFTRSPLKEEIKKETISQNVSHQPEPERIKDIDNSPKLYEKEKNIPVAKSNPLIETQASIDTLPSPDEEIVVKEVTTVDTIQKHPAEKTEPSKKTFDCETTNISAPLDVLSTCPGKNEGSITIDPKNIKGGTPPYLFSLDEGKYFSSQTIYTNLVSGNYSIQIKDKNNCIEKIHAKVEEKKCETMTNHICNPLHSPWVIPADPGKEAEIKLYNKAGVLVYSSHISSGYPAEWDGRDNNGNLVEKGLYIFQISYSDRSEEKGYVTVMY